jgi:hypothetical protein
MPNRLTKGEGLFGALTTEGDLVVEGYSSQVRTATTVADGASMALSAANVVNQGILSATPTTARNVQLPTAATVIALVGATEGTTVEFSVINLDGTNALTMTVNTGTTIVGSASVAANTSGRFAARVASSTAIVVYRIA